MVDYLRLKLLALCDKLGPQEAKIVFFIMDKIIPFISNLVKGFLIILSFSLSYKKMGFENTLIIQLAILIFLAQLILSKGQSQKY